MDRTGHLVGPSVSAVSIQTLKWDQIGIFVPDETYLTFQVFLQKPKLPLSHFPTTWRWFFNDSNWNQGRTLQPRSIRNFTWIQPAVSRLDAVFAAGLSRKRSHFRFGYFSDREMISSSHVQNASCFFFSPRDLGTKRFSFCFCLVLFVVLGIKRHSCWAVSCHGAIALHFLLKVEKCKVNG